MTFHAQRRREKNAVVWKEFGFFLLSFVRKMLRWLWNIRMLRGINVSVASTQTLIELCWKHHIVFIRCDTQWRQKKPSHTHLDVKTDANRWNVQLFLFSYTLRFVVDVIRNRGRNRKGSTNSTQTKRTKLYNANVLDCNLNRKQNISLRSIILFRLRISCTWFSYE